MYNINIKKKIDVDVTLDNIPIETVLKAICEECHSGLEYASLQRQYAEDELRLDNTKHWKDVVEMLEGRLCIILKYLGD